MEKYILLFIWPFEFIIFKKIIWIYWSSSLTIYVEINPIISF